MGLIISKKEVKMTSKISTDNKNVGVVKTIKANILHGFKEKTKEEVENNRSKAYEYVL